MPVKLTRQSAFEYDNIVYGNMTPAMAADYLRNGQIVMRCFADTLKEMYPAPEKSTTGFPAKTGQLPGMIFSGLLSPFS